MTTNSLFLPVTSFLVNLDLEAQKSVSSFLEATLRGGFGYTLRSLVCMTKKPTCENCMLANSCAYKFLFETLPPPDAPRMRGYQAVPRPFTLRAQQRGTSLSVSLTLFGDALAYLPYFIYTFDKLGEKGLGTDSVRFKVKNVLRGEQTVYCGNDGTMASGINSDVLELKPGVPGVGSVHLRFETPLIIRKEGQDLSHFEAPAFFSTLLRRFTNLNAFFGKYKDTQINPQEYLAPVASLEVQSDMHRLERSRYSTRQKAQLDYSGLVGSVTLTGEIGRLMPLLRAGVVIGVGKNTVFGGGVYKMEVVN